MQGFLLRLKKNRLYCLCVTHKDRVNKMLRIIGLIVVSFICAGCQSNPSVPIGNVSVTGDPIASLKATSWSVKTVAGRGLMEYLTLTLTFDNEVELTGFSGCNWFKGHYKITSSQLEVEALSSTKKYCSKVIMYQEHLLLKELSKPLTLSQKNNKVIQLINNKGKVTSLMMQ